MGERIRVLALVAVDYRRSGAPLFLSRCYESVPPEAFDISIWTAGKLDVSIEREWFADRGIRLIEGKCLHPNPFVKRRRVASAISALLSEGPYDVIHVNSGAAWLQRIAVKEAKKRGIPVRIAHSHAGGSGSKLAHLVQKLEAKSVANHATVLAACSNNAGSFLFGDKAWQEAGQLVPNGIDVREFKFDQNRRDALRVEAGVHEDDFVIICVGRLSKRKNQEFIIRLLPSILDRVPQAKLWLLGDGELAEDMKSIVANQHLENAVTFWGTVDTVSDYLSAADLFVMPSISEGFPFACLEAEASGIPCVISSSITADVQIPGTPVARVDLEQPALWILACELVAAHGVRDTDGWKKIQSNGYDCDSMADRVFDLYQIGHCSNNLS